MVNKNQKLYFSGEKNPFDIISEILDKNGLKENLTDFITKRKQGKVLRIKTLFELSKDYASGEIAEKEFISAVQNQLETTEEVAKNINKDVREKLLPLAKKDEVIGQKIEEKTVSPAPITPQMPIKKITPTNEENNKKIKPIENITKTTKTPEVKEVKNISRTGPDNYREPIE